MFENFIRRNTALFLVALVVMVGGDPRGRPIAYASWDRETGTLKAQPVKVERPTI